MDVSVLGVGDNGKGQGERTAESPSYCVSGQQMHVEWISAWDDTRHYIGHGPTAQIPPDGIEWREVGNEGPLLPGGLVPFLRALSSSRLRIIIAKQVCESPVARSSDFFPPRKARNVDFRIKIPILKHWKPLQMISNATLVNKSASAGWIWSPR